MATSTSSAPQAPPQAVVMQMAMGGWVARAMSEISKLNIPDVLQVSGPMTPRNWPMGWM